MHSGCRRGRTLNYSAARPGSGRPIGHLIAWLEEGPTVSEQVHQDIKLLPQLHARNAARERFKARVAAGDEKAKMLSGTEDGPPDQARPYSEPPDIM